MTLSLVLWELCHERPDPIISGRPLSFWASPNVLARGLPSLSSDTNAVLLYTRLVGMRPGELGNAYQNLWPKLPGWLQRRLPQPYFPRDVRLAALNRLFLEARGCPALVPVLIDSLKRDPDPLLRGQIAECLTANFSHDHRAVEALANAAKDKDPRVRVTAVLDLGYCYRHPSIAVPALVGCLRDSDAQVRRSAACSLRMFGSSGSAAGPGLSQLLQDTNPGVRLEAGYALKQIDPAAAVKAGLK
jgi:HEAT repeat protein